MDPNKGLDACRTAKAGVDAAHDEFPTVVNDFATAFGELDDWMTTGGFPPAEWAIRKPFNFPDRAGISAGVAAQLIFMVEPQRAIGQEPSGFGRRLFELLLVCDRVNLSKMAILFPEHASAVDLYRNWPDGVVFLRKRASR